MGLSSRRVQRVVVLGTDGSGKKSGLAHILDESDELSRVDVLALSKLDGSDPASLSAEEVRDRLEQQRHKRRDASVQRVVSSLSLASTKQRQAKKQLAGATNELSLRMERVCTDIEAMATAEIGERAPDTKKRHVLELHRKLYEIVGISGQDLFTEHMIHLREKIDVGLLFFSAVDDRVEVDSSGRCAVLDSLLLLRALGASSIVVAISHMDKIDIEDRRKGAAASFDEIASRVYGVTDHVGYGSNAAVVPISANLGLNIVTRSEAFSSFYRGGSLIEEFVSALGRSHSNHEPLLLGSLYSASNLVVGRVLSGNLSRGDKVNVLCHGGRAGTSRVVEIHRSGPVLPQESLTLRRCEACGRSVTADTPCVRIMTMEDREGYIPLACARSTGRFSSHTGGNEPFVSCAEHREDIEEVLGGADITDVEHVVDERARSRIVNAATADDDIAVILDQSMPAPALAVVDRDITFPKLAVILLGLSSEFEGKLVEGDRLRFTVARRNGSRTDPYQEETSVRVVALHALLNGRHGTVDALSPPGIGASSLSIATVQFDPPAVVTSFHAIADFSHLQADFAFATVLQVFDHGNAASIAREEGGRLFGLPLPEGAQIPPRRSSLFSSAPKARQAPSSARQRDVDKSALDKLLAAFT